jgi:hypothetical protein
MANRLAPRWVPGVVLVACALAASDARAGDSAAAEALFQQAKSLTEGGQWAEACPKFEASYKLDKTLGTLMNLADCEEHVDRIATAWAHWGEAVELAQKAGDKRADFATKRRDALKKRLPMIRIEVTPGPTTLAIFRDDVRIDPAAYGVPLPSDPGTRTLTVRRGDEKLAEKKVTAKEAATEVVTFDLPAIEKAAPRPRPPAGGSSAQRTAGFVVGGVGVGAVLIAGGLEIGAIVAKSAANSPGRCVSDFCTPQGIAQVDRARAYANAGQWLGLGGILVTAVGLTLVLTAPSRGSAPPRTGALAPLSIEPWVGPGTGGLSIRGAL